MLQGTCIGMSMIVTNDDIALNKVKALSPKSNEEASATLVTSVIVFSL